MEQGFPLIHLNKKSMNLSGTLHSTGTLQRPSKWVVVVS